MMFWDDSALDKGHQVDKQNTWKRQGVNDCFQMFEKEIWN